MKTIEQVKEYILNRANYLIALEIKNSLTDLGKLRLSDYKEILDYIEADDEND
jgi:hypothetical protein